MTRAWGTEWSPTLHASKAPRGAEQATERLLLLALVRRGRPHSAGLLAVRLSRVEREIGGAAGRARCRRRGGGASGRTWRRGARRRRCIAARCPGRPRSAPRARRAPRPRWATRARAARRARAGAARAAARAAAASTATTALRCRNCGSQSDDSGQQTQYKLLHRYLLLWA